MPLIDVRTASYIVQAASNWMNIPSPEREYQVTDVCPECGETVDPLDTGSHVVLDLHEGEPGNRTFPENSPTELVLIGCEGYWVINPNRVGIPRENWGPPEEGLPFWDGKGVDPYAS